MRANTAAILPRLKRRLDTSKRLPGYWTDLLAMLLDGLGKLLHLAESRAFQSMGMQSDLLAHSKFNLIEK